MASLHITPIYVIICTAQDSEAKLFELQLARLAATGLAEEVQF